MGTIHLNQLLKNLQQNYSELAPTLQRAAKYVIDNPTDFGIDPIRMTAEKSGVSTYSLVRLAQELEFAGFEEFRAPFKSALRTASATNLPSDWLDKLPDHGRTGSTLARSAENSLSILSNSLQRLTPERADAFITTLTQARTVYVTATRASYALAYYFQHVARLVLPNVQFIPRDMANPIDDLNFANEQDVLLAITVHPYSQITVNACRFARKKGLKLLVITDSQLPLSELSPDAVLTAEMDSPHEFACYLGVMALLESLLHLLVVEGGEAAAENIKSYQDLKARMDGSSPF